MCSIADAGVRGLVVRLARRRLVASRRRRVIRADAGVTINGLVRWTVSRGLAGLEAWAGTPGTVGGAMYGNAHFQGRLISELIERVTVVDDSGMAVARLPAADDGVCLRLQPTASDARGRVVGGFPRRRQVIRPRCEPWRATPSRSASARSRWSRRAPAAFSRIPSRRSTSCPTASRLRLARSSIARA